MGKWQSPSPLGVRLRGMLNLPLVHMWMLIVRAENVHCSIHGYGLKNAPQQRQVDWLNLPPWYVISSPSYSAVCNEHPEPLSGCGSCHPTSAFLCVCPFLIPSCPQPSESLEDPLCCCWYVFHQLSGFHSFFQVSAQIFPLGEATLY